MFCFIVYIQLDVWGYGDMGYEFLISAICIFILCLLSHLCVSLLVFQPVLCYTSSKTWCWDNCSKAMVIMGFYWQTVHEKILAQYLWIFIVHFHVMSSWNWCFLSPNIGDERNISFGVHCKFKLTYKHYRFSQSVFTIMKVW